MTTRASRRPLFAAVAVVATIAGAGCFLVMHVAMTGVVDPLRQPVSSYALTAPGSMLFALGTLAVAASCALLARFGVGLQDEGRLRFGLGCVAFLLTLVVAFRTDASDAVTSASGQIHRFAAGGAFVLLVCLGWMAWRRFAVTDKVAAGVVGWLTALGFGALLVTGVNTFLPELVGGGSWRGVPQRVLLTIHIMLVVVLGLWAGRVGHEAGRSVPARHGSVAATPAESWMRRRYQSVAERPWHGSDVRFTIRQWLLTLRSSSSVTCTDTVTNSSRR